MLLLPAVEDNQQDMGLADEHRAAGWSEANAVWVLRKYVSCRSGRGGARSVCISESGGIFCKKAQA